MENQKIHEFYIKNMICSRCLKVIREELESLGVEIIELRLGKLTFKLPKKGASLSEVEQKLRENEFEFVKDKNEQIAEEIKLILVELINDLPVYMKKKLSDYLVERLHRDYSTLSKTFSKTEEITIERYFILLRIEKAKELIEYGELNFSEIAYELGYNSIYHLSGQFKQVTGKSMSEYKQLEKKRRLPLDKIL